MGGVNFLPANVDVGGGTWGGWLGGVEDGCEGPEATGVGTLCNSASRARATIAKRPLSEYRRKYSSNRVGSRSSLIDSQKAISSRRPMSSVDVFAIGAAGV